jgi:hypothetical protein
MTAEQAILLGISVLLLLVAHGARAARWAFLFPPNYVGGRLTLLIGLGIAYAVNALVPLRIGEIIRGAVVTRLNRVRFPYVMATIVAERVADLVAVAALIILSSAIVAEPADALGAATIFAAAAAALVLFALVVRRSETVRRWIWRFSGIFNDRIRIGIADFVWSSAETIAGGSLLRWRFLLATFGMWSLYLAAYAALGQALGAPLLEVVAAVVAHPLESLAATLGRAGTILDHQSLLIFVITPIFLILAYGALMQNGVFARAAGLILRHGRSGRGAPSLQRDRFSGETGYESFLGALFSGEDRAVSGFGMEAIDDCIVHKFFHGGSDAVTALVETGQQRLLIRKFAVGGAAMKLKTQFDWLLRHQDSGLPLVQVVGERHGTRVYSYDMPLVTPANDFYDVIHSSTTAGNRDRLEQVLTSIHEFHGLSVGVDADDAVVSRYLAEKATANAQAILSFAHRAIGRDEYSINGVTYDLGEWQCLADASWLLAQIRNRATATIHGDLTVENVIIAPDDPAGLYIIDPNPENIFDSPMIDWAKMMQSLHLGYETLNRSASCIATGNAIQLAASRSQKYAELHQVLEERIRASFGEDGVREVYFHELVNYLRLTTYKLRQSHQRGIAFFACTSLLLRQYQERFR